LLQALAKEGIAGATVVRGVAGYTRSAGITTTSLVDAGGQLPLVIDFIDSEDNVERMMPVITEMVGIRLVTTMDVDIRHGGAFSETP
jgi:PII-like signaling protein